MKKRIVYPFLAFTLTLLGFSIFFGDVMLHPNRFVTEADGDGIKNHFVYSYYIKHDKGLQFTGMNYPYGEHIFFPDAQPILSMPLGWVNRNLFRVEHISLGISNGLLFWSIGFCGLFMFLILRKFNLPPWYALLAAVLIALLSPQLNRIHTHQSLGFAMFLPAMWYSILQFEDAERRKWLWLVFLGVLIFVFAGLHLYYLALGFFFIAAYCAIIFLSNLKSLHTVWKRIIPLIVAGLIPLLIYQIFMNVTDPNLASRVKTPWGFFYYTASFQSIFIPVYTPFEDFVRGFIKYRPIKWEGYAAVGITGSLVLLFTLVRMGRFFVKKQFIRGFRLSANPRLNQFVWAGFLLFLFSMAVPFTWGLEWLLDYISPLKQFRSVGRFSWVFYYAFTVYAACYVYYIYKRFLQKGMRPYGQFFIFGMLALWALNDYAFLKQARKGSEVRYQKNIFKDEQLPYLDTLKNINFDKNDYQAMIGLPLYYKGSERVSIYNSNPVFRWAGHYAYHIGLPMMNSYIARMSIDQSLKIGQMWSDTLIERELLKELPSEKPFLGVVIDDQYYPLKPVEQHILSKSKQIAKVGNVRFFEIPLSAFEANTTDVQTQFTAKDSLYEYKANNQTYYLTQPEMIFFEHRTYDESPNDYAMRGSGGLKINRSKKHILFDDVIPTQDTLVLTYWVKNNYDHHFPNLHHKGYHPDGYEMFHEGLDVGTQIAFQDGWIMMKMDLSPLPEGHRHQIFLANPQGIEIDDLIIRPKSVDVFWTKDDDTFIYNNISVKQE